MPCVNMPTYSVVVSAFRALSEGEPVIEALFDKAQERARLDDPDCEVYEARAHLNWSEQVGELLAFENDAHSLNASLLLCIPEVDAKLESGIVELCHIGYEECYRQAAKRNEMRPED